MLRLRLVKSELAIKINGEQNKIVMVRGRWLLGLAQSLSGQKRPGQATCQSAVDAAPQLNDPLLLARAQLALAEASLVAGDAKGALINAQKSQMFFATTRLSESEWRAWLIEGLASEKVGDHNNARESLARAKELLSSLQQKWGAGIYSSYTNRPDIEAYRKQLDASIVAIH